MGTLKSVYESCLIFYLFTSFTKVFSQKIAINYTSKGAPDVYLDDTITFTCSATDFTDLWTLALKYHYGYSLSRDGCIKSSERWVTLPPPNINNITGIVSSNITDRDCVTAARPEGFSIHVEITVTTSGLDGKFYCGGIGSGLQQILPIESKSVNLSLTKVAPRNLQMIISPEEPVEGEEFVFTCSSEGAEPPSKYEYRVDRSRNLGLTAIETNKYTPLKADREGITLSCTDIEHLNWKGGNTTQSVHIVPKYMGSIDKVNISIAVNTHEFKLDCEKFVAGNPRPNYYKWKRYGMPQDLTTSYYILSALQNATTELVECAAANSMGKRVTIKWYITWNLPMAHPITVTSGPKTSPTTIILGGVIGVIILINIIVITAGCVWWRRKGYNPGKKSKQPTAASGISSYNELGVMRADGHEYTSVQPHQSLNYNGPRTLQDHRTGHSYYNDPSAVRDGRLQHTPVPPHLYVNYNENQANQSSATEEYLTPQGHTRLEDDYERVS